MSTPNDGDAERAAHVRRLIEQLRPRLIDLSGRNRLISFRHAEKSRRELRVVAPNLSQTWSHLCNGRELVLESLPSPPLASTLAAGEWAKANNIVISWNNDENGWHGATLQTPYLPLEFERRASAVHGAARLSQSERGVTALFAVFGFVEWYESDVAQMPTLSPLLTLPLKIDREKRGTKHRYAISWSGEDTQPNIALSERLKDSLPMPAFASWDDPVAWLDQVEASLPKTARPWRVHRWLTIGLLDFMRLPMWNDLDPARWSNATFAGLVGDVLYGVERQPSPMLDANAVDEPPIRDLVPFTLLDADSSQIRAIAEAMRGRSVVIQGPPGTGKSQTIANLIGLALFRGQTVLFVSEKQAALDVVLRRLEEVGLDQFCLALHSARADKKVIINTLNERIERNKPAGPRRLSSFDLDLDRQTLNRLPKKLHAAICATGATLHQLIGKLVKDRIQTPELPFRPHEVPLGPVLSWTSADLQQRDSLLVALQNSWVEAVGPFGERAAHPWFDIASAEMTPLAQDALVGLVAACAQCAKTAQAAAADANLFCHQLADISVDNRIALAAAVAEKELPNRIGDQAWLPMLTNWAGRQELGRICEELVVANREFSEVRAHLDSRAELPSVAALEAVAQSIERLGAHQVRLHELDDTATECHRLAARWALVTSLQRRLPAPRRTMTRSSDAEVTAIRRHLVQLESRRWWRFASANWWRAKHFARRPDFDAIEFLRARATALAEVRSTLIGLGFRRDSLLADVRQCLEALSRGRETWNNLAAVHSSLFVGGTFEQVARFVDIAAQVCKTGEWLDATDVPAPITAWLLESASEVRFRNFQLLLATEVAATARFEGSLADVKARLSRRCATTLDGQTTAAIGARLTKAADAAATIGRYVRYIQLQSQAALLGVSGIVEKCELASAMPCNLAAIFQRVYLEQAVAAHIDSDPELRMFHGREHELIRKRFAANDVARRHFAASEVLDKLCQRQAPVGIRQGPVGALTEAGLIRKLRGQARPRVAIRDLFDRASAAIQTVSPCLLLSPLSVSQFIKPGAMTFDLVVMDEASQLRPEDAVGALLRARQAIIVGDSKQMPPSDFFNANFGDDESDFDPEIDQVVEESVLDLAKSRLHPFAGPGSEAPMLLWHYRSRHPSLVAFSNLEFYDNALQLFPPDSGIEADLGVSLQNVSGVYAASQNPVEAKSIAVAAIGEMRAHPERSLGVVALNIQQRDLIEAEIEALIAADDFAGDYLAEWQGGLSPFFIKNLENVQGDERDTILISTVFGRDGLGKFNQNFGAVSGRSGPRRLNVLLTRAVRKMIVFTSMDPEWISAPSDGAQLLKRFLLFARTGSLPVPIAGGSESGFGPESPFEQAVLDALVGKGFLAVPQVGVGRYRIDIAIRHPESPQRFALGIECDGASYHSSTAARDRDRLRQQILEQLGWSIARVWSLDWWRDSRSELDRLVERIRDAIAQDEGPPPQRQPPTIRADSGSQAPENGVEPKSKSPLPPNLPKSELQVTGSNRMPLAQEQASGQQRSLDLGELQRFADGVRATMLRTQLISLREKIKEETPGVRDERGILRKRMLEQFLAQRPLSPEQYRTKMPRSLVQDTDPVHESKYLETILEVIRAI